METASEVIKERGPSRYSMVVLAAKRAKQLKEGAPTLIDTESTNTLTVALEEIAAGKIDYLEVEEPTDDEAAAARRQAAAAAAAPPARPTSPEMQQLTENLKQADMAAHFSEPESMTEPELETASETESPEGGEGDSGDVDGSLGDGDSETETTGGPAGGGTSTSEE